MNQLAIHGGDPIFKDNEGVFRWPVFDQKDERDLIAQLHESVSIYNKSGIIDQFEREFAEYHDMPFSLLSNSGTSAIYSMYEGLNLQQGDEVLCPVYTFHATVSPLMYTGATPVFCDCDEFGNIRLDEIESRYTKATKAVVISHMWGMPVADTLAIREFCNRKGISLLEDCSHAHGALIGAEKVGSFGDASAWSLQGQKTITGGEGGIMLTKSKELFERALLQGHYNKRAKSQIRESSHLYKYHLTGMGQKFRAHPLAIRLALNQFHKLESILTQRQLFADRFVEGIKHIPFLKPLLPKNDISPSNYALIVKFEKSANLQITREAFVDTLIKEGLCEVDIPGSTGLLHTQPLFTDPHEVLPRLYDAPLGRQVGFSKAESFHSCIIKFPVWSFKSDQSIVDGYVEGINKVGQYIMSHGSLE